ncbi:MAG: response regulator [Chthoniobacteraceae bacterium]
MIQPLKHSDLPRITVVEDSDEDYGALSRALKRLGRPVSLDRFVRGEDALLSLRDAEQGAFPALMLLDLNLPGIGGGEVLKRLRQHESTRSLPVIVLSSSDNPEEVAWCYEQGANAYHVKGLNYADFCQSVELIFQYWFATARLPHGPLSQPQPPSEEGAAGLS